MDNNNFRKMETKNDENKSSEPVDINIIKENNLNLIKSIKSLMITRKIFSFILEKKKLDLIIYNNQIKQKLNIDIEYYKKASGKLKICERNGLGREYILNTCIKIFEGEYKNNKRNGKGKAYRFNGNLVFEGEYINGKKMEKEKNILIVY